jgi:hypothetical protein
MKLRVQTKLSMKTFLTTSAIVLVVALMASYAKADTVLTIDPSTYWDYATFTDTEMAQQFLMGSNSYNLTSISLDLQNATNGFSNLSVGLYSDASGSPGTLLSSLTYSSTGPDSSLFGMAYNSVTFTGSGLLQAGNSYWVGVSNPDGNYADPTAGHPWMIWYGNPVIGEASLGTFQYGTSQMTNWSGQPGMTITGTAVPEPSTYAFFGLGALSLLIAYRRRAA